MHRAGGVSRHGDRYANDGRVTKGALYYYPSITCFSGKFSRTPSGRKLIPNGLGRHEVRLARRDSSALELSGKIICGKQIASKASGLPAIATNPVFRKGRLHSERAVHAQGNRWPTGLERDT
jgi:hypothetical protein